MKPAGRRAAVWYVMHSDAGAAKRFMYFKQMKPKANGAPWRTGLQQATLPTDVVLTSDTQKVSHRRGDTPKAPSLL